MRAVLALIVLVLVLLVLGWITVRTNGNNQATVTVETQKIEKDTHQVIEKSEEALEAAGQKIHENLNSKSPSDDSKAPESTPSSVPE